MARIYSMARVLCDTHMRERLDPVSPASLRPVFKRVLRHLQRGKALAPLTFLEGHSRLALDDTGSCASTTLHGASCLPTVHRNGSITSTHPMRGAASIHPDMRAVIPWRLIPRTLSIDTLRDRVPSNQVIRRASGESSAECTRSIYVPHGLPSLPVVKVSSKDGHGRSNR